MSRIEIFRGETGRKWYWRVRAENGQIAATGGQGYYSKWNAKRAARKQFPALAVS